MQVSEPELDKMSQISDIESILTFKLTTEVRKSQLPTYDSEPLLDKIEECIELLNHVCKFSKKPNYDIISGLTNQISSLMRKIYDIHEDIYFTDRFVSKDDLFISYQPEEIKRIINDLKAGLRSHREEIARLNLQQEERATISENVVSENFEQKFKVEREKNQNLQSIIVAQSMQINALQRTANEQRARFDYLQNVSQPDFNN